jgi:hypothetical protein
MPAATGQRHSADRRPKTGIRSARALEETLAGDTALRPQCALPALFGNRGAAIDAMQAPDRRYDPTAPDQFDPQSRLHFDVRLCHIDDIRKPFHPRPLVLISFRPA